VNPYKKELDYFKLLPTHSDRNSFYALLRTEQSNIEDQINNAYKFGSLGICGVEGIGGGKMRKD
jgi:hypothetical protein